MLATLECFVLLEYSHRTMIHDGMFDPCWRVSDKASLFSRREGLPLASPTSPPVLYTVACQRCNIA